MLHTHHKENQEGEQDMSSLSSYFEGAQARDIQERFFYTYQTLMVR
jgi:hypothetical protein